MPRAKGNDLCEIFGFAPDDVTNAARKQWKSQECPFVGGTCIKHSHPQNGKVIVYGSCSIVNKTRNGAEEEVILCAQRLYADNYKSLHAVVKDATQIDLPIYMADEYSRLKKSNSLPGDYVVLLGHNSGKEIKLSQPDVIQLSLDWVMARVVRGDLKSIIPCEVQSMDTTGNYQANWLAYSKERKNIPDSEHGMNWANVWKRLIPQLILKGSIAATSKLCKQGHYFIIPDQVYQHFERLIGDVRAVNAPSEGVLTVMTYTLGPQVPYGSIRLIERRRTVRMLTTEFAQAFASGKQLPLGTQLDEQVAALLYSL
jgi:hypothetical protein